MIRVKGCLLTLICLLFSLAGCSSLNDIYFHNPQLNEAAKTAAATFENARPDELWQTMLDNVAASANIEQKILANSAEYRFEGKLTNLENLKWRDLLRCSKGACWSDYQAEAKIINHFPRKKPPLFLHTPQEKLDYLQAQIKLRAEEVNKLDTYIRNYLPVETEEPLEIISELTSKIIETEDKIKTVHEELELLKQQALNNIQDKLDEITAPLIAPFPEFQSELQDGIDTIFTDIKDDLEKAKLKNAQWLMGMQYELQNSIVEEFILLISDLGIDVDKSKKSRKVFDKAIAAFLVKAAELTLADQLLDKFKKMLSPINSELIVFESVITKLQTNLGKALEASALPSERIQAVNDIFNKTEYPNLLKIKTLETVLQGGLIDVARGKLDKLNIGEAYEILKNRELSLDFTSALEADIGGEVCQKKPCKLQHIIDFMKKDESRIEIIRRNMQAEFRASELSIYRQQLRSLNNEITIMKGISVILNEQLEKQAVLSEMVEKQMEAQDISEDITVYHGLDCLARSAARVHGANCAPDTKTARDHFNNTLIILSAYFSLNGYIKNQEYKQWIALVRHKHIESINESKLAAQSREQLIANGLNSLVAFTDGGITTEQIAGLLRLVNSSLLLIIAEDI